MKRTAFIIFLLLSMIAVGSFAQMKEKAKTSTVKAKNNTYLRTDPGRTYIIYTNKNKVNTVSETVKRLLDGDGQLSLYENGAIRKLLRKVFPDETLKTKDGRIIISILFTDEGKAIYVSFLVPRFIAVSPEQIETLDTEIRKNITAKIEHIQKGKKYIYWGLRVPFSKVLDGSYLY